ncbi:N-acetyltransferase family protein [Flagellimonas sp. 2504JD1-5]
MKFKIRFAELYDVNEIVKMCQLHASFERASYDMFGKAEKLARDLFAKKPKLYCLVIADDQVLLGYATYMKQYATWDANDYVYMDCLFIREFARGRGLGESLMERIRMESKQLGCDQVQWQTPSFNIRAMQFYERLGAVSKSKERFFLPTNAQVNSKSSD